MMRFAPQIPEELKAMLEAVRRVGRPRLVGGGVRDGLLGLKPKDFDVEVGHADFETLHRALAPFGATDVVGRSFGVIKVRGKISGAEYDFSLPRRESKTGAGHRGFAVEPDPKLSDADAAARRDFTVNAIAYNPFTDSLLDPHGGVADLQARVLRHTSAAFGEDPLRVLRGMQFAARFDFTLAPETAALSRQMADTFRELPVERIWGEWEKWANQAIKPARGLEVLEATGWLVHFPEIAALRGTLQEPAWHPEGDVFTHTQHCLEALVSHERARGAARHSLLMWAVLAHDFGKAKTTVRAEKDGVWRWLSPGHAAASGPLAEQFLRRIGAPMRLDAPVRALVENHHAHDRTSAPLSDNAVRRLARRLQPATIEELARVMLADSHGRPPLESPETIARIGALTAHAERLQLAQLAPQPIMLGRHMLALGQKPGPEFKRALDAAFEAQLDGVFADEAGGVIWLRNFLG
jgi:tRNA nucleotidyltransferase (CCA-adding enzyme)